MEIERRKFQGVLNILSFNRHFYVVGLLVLSCVILSKYILNWSETLLWIIIALFSYGLIIPLIVSAYVYDFSKYYQFKWLDKIIKPTTKINTIVNINAGFDETSFLIKDKYPEASLKVFDFYNEQEHTEAAIVRARKVSLEYPNTKVIDSKNIPLDDNSVEVVFLLSAAHEIRKEEEKVLFLKECHRICKPDGKVIMVEHLRDFSNFMAFSIGFTHFFSKNTWNKVFKESGFRTISETKFTPFMSVFNCKP